AAPSALVPYTTLFRSSRWRGAAARAARGLRLRIRVPAREHERAPDPGRRDPVPDPGRGIRVHFLVAGPRDIQAGGRRVRVRAPRRGQSAAGRMAAQHSLMRVGRSNMKTMTRVMAIALVALVALPLAACKKEEA